MLVLHEWDVSKLQTHMMATNALTESEREECKNFLEAFINSAKSDEDSATFPHDSHFESLCFCVTDEEIPGELTDIINRFLHYKYVS